MIILDTHTFIWYVSNPEKLSKRAFKTIENAKKRQILISSISVWEIYMLINKRRIRFSIPTNSWLEKVEESGIFEFVPVNNKVAAESVNLPHFKHRDPADRMIIATARLFGATLITSDEKILKYKNVKSLN